MSYAIVEAADLGTAFKDVWQQAIKNHHNHSRTGSDDTDIFFLTLGLAGEAGEVANFVKKRWRDGDDHIDDIQKEIADVCAYAFMLASMVGLTPASLIQTIAGKQQVFIEKMKRQFLRKEIIAAIDGDHPSKINIGKEVWERLKDDPKSIHELTCVGDKLFFRGVEINPFADIDPDLWEAVQ